MDLQDQPLQASQQFTDEVDVAVGQLKALPEMLSLPALMHPYHQDEISSTAPARSPNATASKRQGQLSCSYTQRDSSPVLAPTMASSTVLPRLGSEPPLQSAAVNEGQGQLCTALDHQHGPRLQLRVGTFS